MFVRIHQTNGIRKKQPNRSILSPKSTAHRDREIWPSSRAAVEYGWPSSAWGVLRSFAFLLISVWRFVQVPKLDDRWWFFTNPFRKICGPSKWESSSPIFGVKIPKNVWKNHHLSGGCPEFPEFQAIFGGWVENLSQVLPSDPFGDFKWPFQGLSDLHLGYQKVTWKKLAYSFLFFFFLWGLLHFRYLKQFGDMTLFRSFGKLAVKKWNRYYMIIDVFLIWV